MDARRRKILNKASTLISEAKDLVQEVADDERSSFDNLLDRLQRSERDQRMDEVAAMLEECVNQLSEVYTNLIDAQGE